MSVIRKKPFIDDVVDKLSLTQRQALINVMNTAGNNVEASLLNMPAKGITPVLFKLDEANIKTGILIYVDDVPCTLIAYHRFQDVLLFELHPESTSYNKVNEYCDINELRRLLTVGEKVTSGEIDSGLTADNAFLVADGDGSTKWVEPQEGSAAYLIGLDSNGDIIKDELPEGIVVDQTVVEDSENAVSGGAVYDELADVKDDITDLQTEMETKANVDGNYPTMTVGAADNLTPYSEDSGDDQDEPFSFQGTGCGNGEQQVDTGALALLKEKQGHSVVVNQWVQNGTFANDSIWGANLGSIAIANNKCTFTVETSSTGNYIDQAIIHVVGHKYLCCATVTPSKNTSCAFYIGGVTGDISVSANTKTTITAVKEAEGTSTLFAVYCNRNLGLGVDDTCVFENLFAIDLTQWFGSNDNIPAHLLSHPENFFRYYQGSLAYNTGTLVNSNGRYLKAIGRNQCDNTNNELGDLSAGSVAAGTNCITDYIKVIPNTTYYRISKSPTALGSEEVSFYDKDKNYINRAFGATFTTPVNCIYIRSEMPSNSGSLVGAEQCISIYYDGESGYDQYYPYEELSNIDTGTETLLAFDYKTPDGVVHRNTVDIEDAGELSWSAVAADGYAFVAGVSLSALPKANGKIIASNLDSKITTFSINAYNDILITFAVNAFADTAAVKAAFNNIEIQYEKAEPTTEQGTTFSENVTIDDFGSMSFEGTSGVPQGNLIFYPVDYKAFLDSLYNELSGSADKVLSTNTSQSDLDTYLNGKGYYKQVDLSSGITDIAGLTYSVKKLTKVGNIYTLNVVAQNGTGSNIAADTALFSLPSGSFNSVTAIRTICIINDNDIGAFNLNYNGRAGCLDKAFNSGEYININISYYIA